MSSPQSNPPTRPLTSGLPGVMLFFGGALTLVGALVSIYRDGGRELGYAWLLAFMFYYTLGLGALFMVLVHHLTDAGWSVGIRRFCEHLAALFLPWLLILFLPIGLLGSKIYAWMKLDPATNNLVAAKYPVFTIPGFWITSFIFFGILGFLSWRLRTLSLEQDETGSAECTRKMSFHSGWGIVAFGLTLTFSGVLWMQAVQYQWFSAMYGVYFFSSSVWAGLAFIYVLGVFMLEEGILTPVLKRSYFYFLGMLLLAFTLLSSYTEFAQYFVVWNANMPTETFWYIQRERGGWFAVSMLLILGKCFIPFFALLPMSTKSSFKVLVPVCLLIAVMHYTDLAFNIMPVLHPVLHHGKWMLLPLGCVLLMGGILGKAFIRNFNAHPPYPQRDPRLLEAMGVSQNVVNDLMDANASASAGGAK